MKASGFTVLPWTSIRVGMVLLAAAAVACGQLNTAALDEPHVTGRTQAAASGQPMERKDPPNVVLILTDDQRWDTVSAMPTVVSELAGHGISFERGYVSNRSAARAGRAS